MNKTYVTLVSDQAVPNVQYIKEFKEQISTYLFISTKKMEESAKSSDIINSCSLKTGTYKIIEVDEENFNSILKSINDTLKLPLFKNSEGYIANCTLGTKIMSIALYEYFREKENTLLLYTPIGTNKYRTILNNDINKIFDTLVTVEEYVRAYGIKISGTSTPVFKEPEYCRIFFDKFLNFTENEFNILSRLQNDEDQRFRKKGILDLKLITGLGDFLNTILFPFSSQESLSKKEVKFLTGGWFEEWTYFLFKQKLNLLDDQIAIGLNTQIDAANDLDVVFMFKNQIHIVECKSLLDEKYLQENTLYKSGALIDKFGRNAKSYLFTLSNLRTESGELRKGINDRAKQQKITVADRVTIYDKLEEFLLQFN